MSRNVEDIFGGVVKAPHQAEYIFTSPSGGEKSLTLPFYPTGEGFVTIRGSVQVPDENYSVDGNVLSWDDVLVAGDVVYCLFDKVLSPEYQDNDNNNGSGGVNTDIQTKILPYEVSSPTSKIVLENIDTAFNVRTIRIQGVTQDLGYGFTYDKDTKTITLAEGITAEDIADSPVGYVLVVAVADIYNTSDAGAFPLLAASRDGGSLIGTSSGKTVQQELDTTIKFLGNYEDGSLTVTSLNQEIRFAGDKYYVAAGVTLPFTTTGVTAESWIVDGSKFVKMNDESVSVTTGATILEPSKVSEIEFGDDDYKGVLQVAEGGVLKVGIKRKNRPLIRNMTVPYVVNTGTVITTAQGNFAEKMLFLPSHNFENTTLSPSIGFTYNSTGTVEVSVISPYRQAGGTIPWPNSKNLGGAYRTVAFKDFTEATYNKIPSPLGQSTSTRYIQIAKWTVSGTPWNTEYKAMLISSNTDDRFIGSLTVEGDIQASGTSLATTSNITLANMAKYFNVKFDGPSDRIPYANATSYNIPMFGVTGDGTYLYLWAVIPGGYSSNKLTEIHKGTGSALVTDYTASTVVTTAPTGLVMLPVHTDYNGNNASMANNGCIISADNHVRICNSSGSYSSRTDILKDGFIWGGYGTYKSSRQDCSISRSGTGVYVVTGPHSAAGWNITQPCDNTGQQVAIATISTSSDGLTNTVSVFAIKYTYDSTTGVVTRGTGDAMDIPAGSWVDLHASTTF